MAARAVTSRRALPMLALLMTAGLAQAQDGIFNGAFEIGQSNPVPGPATFQNEAALRVDQMLNSSYRFDALFTDFNSDGCLDPFIFSHADWGATSRLWLNRCDGSGTFVYADHAAVNHNIHGASNCARPRATVRCSSSATSTATDGPISCSRATAVTGGTIAVR